MTASQGPFDLTGKIAVVTGGANGIGAGIAEVLAQAGAKVIIADVLADAAASQAEALVGQGYAAGWVEIDVASERSVLGGCARIVAEHGTPWILVNNAAIQDRALLHESTTEDWDQMHAINARGPYLMTREVTRAMVAEGKGGRVVNIASMALSNFALEGHITYTASKGAVLGLTRATALELVKHGITANAVYPGSVMTPGAMNHKGPPMVGPGMRPAAMGLNEAHDIGAAVLFFASPGARRVTNQVLAVDSGWSVS